MTAELRAFEDIQPGEMLRCGSIEITREAILAFAQVYDPQPFHLDEAAARASLLGGLAASGWHTAAVGMRLFYDGFLCHVASMGSPGIDELRWLRPVRPGDRLGATITLVDKRLSASRPDRGFLKMVLDLRNDADKCVMTQRFSVIIQRRGAVSEARPVSGSAAVPASNSGVFAADPMLTAFFNEVAIGEEATLGSQLFAPEAIVAFASAYDPQDFHLDPERAKQSHFGGMIASGWQTAAFWMKHYVAARVRSAEARAEAGLPAAVGGPSPGFDDLKWLQPVRAGETIVYGLKVVDKKETRRKGWGLILSENTGRRIDGTPVFSFIGRMLWPIAAP